MRGFLKTVLIILMAGTGFMAHINEAPAFELQKSTIENFVINEVKKQTAVQLKEYGEISEIEVKVMNLPIDNIITTGNKMPEIKVVSNFDKFNPYDIKKIVITENGRTIRTIPVNVKISVYKNALVAKDYITQHEIINNANTYYKKIEVGSNIKDVLIEGNFNQPLVATRNFTKDGLILSCYTKSKPEVLRNSDVKIIFKHGDNFNIEIYGIAIREGKIGDEIIVKNTKYNKTHTATVVGTNTVEVRL